MTPLQLERRSALLLRNNAAIERWPAPSPRLRTASLQRTGQDFLLEMTAVAEALEALAKEDPTAANLVKLRYFAGMTMAEAASTLGMPLRSSEALWTYARAWLRRQIGRQHSMSAGR